MSLLSLFFSCLSTVILKLLQLQQLQWSTIVQPSTSLKDIGCTFLTAYSILSYKRDRVDLSSHFHTENPSHLCKTLLVDTYKALVSEKGTEHWKHPMLAKMSRDSQWNLCGDLCMSCSAIPSNNKILKKRSHLCISVLLLICDISQTYGSDKVLLNICKHNVQRRNQFLFLLNKIAWF